jgi:hypothetical protein
MSNFKLSEAAKEILGLTEDSKSTFDANIASKRGQRGAEGTQASKGLVGQDKLSGADAYGTKEVGKVGLRVTQTDDEAPYPTKGVPSATPPGATPPVGSQKDGVGASMPQGQPQQTMGRADLAKDIEGGHNVDDPDYTKRSNRQPSKLAPQMMQSNAGATFQSYGEDIEAMLSGENLSEEFKERATTIFEAAVNSRVVAIVEQVEEELANQFEQAIEEVKEELATKVDDYLNYMVEEWVKDNAIAIEKGLRSEIVEDFIEGLRNLFVEHYIDIPEDKVDVVEELTAKVEELESSLNEQITSSVEMKKELNEHKKYEVIYAACEGLTQTQVEKMKSLAEGIEFTTEEEFGKKLSTIKESYFNSAIVTADNSALDDEVIIEDEKKASPSSADPLIEAVAKTISQRAKL